MNTVIGAENALKGLRSKHLIEAATTRSAPKGLLPEQDSMILKNGRYAKSRPDNRAVPARKVDTKFDLHATPRQLRWSCSAFCQSAMPSRSARVTVKIP